MITIGAIAAILTLCGISINLRTIMLSLGIVDAVLIYVDYRQRTKIRLKWHTEEGICLLLCVLLVVCVSIWRFGFNLQLTYEDVDASRL